LENLAENLTGQASRLLADSSTSRDNLGVSGKRLLSALKTCIVLWRWMVTGDEELVAEEEGIYPFEIFRLIESIDRMLLAAASIQKLMDLPALPEEPAAESGEKAPKSPALLRIELLRQKVLNGIDGPAASLTLVPGIGAAWARKLSSNRIADLTALANASVDQLAALSGLSAKRAEKWIANAADASLQIPPIAKAPHVPTIPPDHDLPVDPYRLRRALDLTVVPEGRLRWAVSGGSEPRLVVLDAGLLSCSCPDHAKGKECKHLIAVRLHRGDPEICRAAALSRRDAPFSHAYLDLFQLWFDR
jgi:helicase